MGNRKRIGIVFALKQERRGFERVILGARANSVTGGGLTWWSIGGIELVAAVSGVGAERSGQATEAILDKGVDAVICAGFAAGLDGELRVGDVLVARRVLGDTGPVECCEIGRIASPPVELGYSVRRGDLVSHNSIVRTPAEKAEIHRTTGAWALDMESHAAGQVCRRRAVPFAAIRAVSDTVDQCLPGLVEALAATDRPLTRLAIAAACPRAWPGLIRLRRQARVAAGNLGDFLGFLLVKTTQAAQGRR